MVLAALLYQIKNLAARPAVMAQLLRTDSFTRTTILAVDDEVTVLELMVETLTDMGYDTLSATGAESALALMKDHPSVDLLVTDVRMPEMSGVDLAHAARHCRPHMPVVFVTGYAAEFQSGARQALPGSRMLTKPFSMDKFGRTVKEMICQSRSSGA